jgi:hypothetical protein
MATSSMSTSTSNNEKVVQLKTLTSTFFIFLIDRISSLFHKDSDQTQMYGVPVKFADGLFSTVRI